MQAPPRIPPVAVLYDSSLEDRIDQVLALAMVLALDTSREARLGALSVSRNDFQIAAFAEILVRFYRGERPGTAPGRTSVPIGMFADGIEARVAPAMISAVVNRVGQDGNSLYPRDIEELNDTADPVAVLRNALSAQQDQRAVVVVAGGPVNLLGLMALPGGSDLVQRKVRELVVASGMDVSGLSELLDRWPGPVVLADDDLDLRYPAAAIEEDFAWAADHPVVDAYRAAGTMPYDAAASAIAAVLYAVRPDQEHFSLSDPAAGGPRRLLTIPEQRDRTVGAIRELVSITPPEPRRGRGG